MKGGGGDCLGRGPTIVLCFFSDMGSCQQADDDDDDGWNEDDGG